MNQNYPGQINELTSECVELTLKKDGFLSLAALADTFSGIGSADEGPQPLRALEYLVGCRRHTQTQNTGSCAITLAHLGA